MYWLRAATQAAWLASTNTEDPNVLVVAPRDSTGAAPAAADRLRFYVFVTGEYQAYAFLVPALAPRERRIALPLLLMVPLMLLYELSVQLARFFAPSGRFSAAVPGTRF